MCTKVYHITSAHTSMLLFFLYFFFTKYCKENPWTRNVHNPSTKGNPFAGCGWHSIYWSAVVYSTLYCWDKTTIMLLYNQSKNGWKRKQCLFDLYFKSFDSCGLWSNKAERGGRTTQCGDRRCERHVGHICRRGGWLHEQRMFPDRRSFGLKYRRNHWRGLTRTAFVFWRPQLLKLDTVCRIPSNTLAIPDTKMKNVYKSMFVVSTLTQLLLIPSLSLQDNVLRKDSKEV